MSAISRSVESIWTRNSARSGYVAERPQTIINRKAVYIVGGGMGVRRYPFSFLVLAICVFDMMPAYASAPIHGAKAAGMNTAFTAVADDPSAVLHNPAGITQLDGTRIYAGGSAVIPNSTYHSLGGESVDTQFQAFFPPNFYITHGLSRYGMTAGLGIYAPFGIGGRKWPADGLTRYSSIESTIGTLTINPTLAVEVRPGLSVAAGFDYMLAQNLTDTAIDQSAAGAADARMKIKTHGDGWGYNLGLLYRPGGAWSVGLAYRSGICVDQKGTLDMNNIAPPVQPLFGGSSFQTPVSGKVDFPQMADIGIAYQPTERWVIDVDAEWAGWSSFQRVQLDLATEVPAAGLTDISVPQDWHDTWAYKIGADFQISDRLSLRAGYAFLNTAVPEATLTAANPDAGQHNVSIGLGWREGRWTIDGYYNLGIFKTRHVTNTNLSGRYETYVHYFGTSVGYKF